MYIQLHCNYSPTDTQQQHNCPPTDALLTTQGLTTANWHPAAPEQCLPTSQLPTALQYSVWCCAVWNNSRPDSHWLSWLCPPPACAIMVVALPCFHHSATTKHQCDTNAALAETRTICESQSLFSYSVICSSALNPSWYPSCPHSLPVYVVVLQYLSFSSGSPALLTVSHASPRPLSSASSPSSFVLGAWCHSWLKFCPGFLPLWGAEVAVITGAL